MRKFLLALVLMLFAGAPSARAVFPGPVASGGRGSSIIGFTTVTTISSVSPTAGLMPIGSPTTYVIATEMATMTPVGQKFVGLWQLVVSGTNAWSSCTGGDTADFAINSSTGAITPTASGSALPAGTYTVCAEALQPGAQQSPFFNPVTITIQSGITPPSEASQAGFTTLAANYDFSTATYANPSTNWYDYPNTNVALPWHNTFPGGYSGCGQWQQYLSSYIFQTTDQGHTVIDIQYPTSLTQLGQSNSCNTMSMSTVRDRCYTSQGPCDGTTFPNMYVESIYRLDPNVPANVANGIGPSSVWSWAVDQNGNSVNPIELDFGETAASTGGQYGNSGWRQWQTTPNPNADFWCTYATQCFGTGTGNTNLPGGGSFSVNTYHKYGMLLTSDGATASYACSYVDDILQNCQNVSATTAQYLERNYIVAWSGNGIAGTEPTENLYIQSIRVWSCVTWASGQCNGGPTLFNSGGLTYWEPSPNHITSVSISNSNFTTGTAGTVGTLSTVESNGTFGGSYSLVSSGQAADGATCATTYGGDGFSISSSNLNFSGTTPAGSYPHFCVKATHGALTYVADLTLTGTAPQTGTCGAAPMGAEAADAAAAGFTTCALYTDWTTAIPNNVGTGLPTNWLDCAQNGGDNPNADWTWGLNWFEAGVFTPCTSNGNAGNSMVYQDTDSDGHLALHIQASPAILQAGNGDTWLLTTGPYTQNNPTDDAHLGTPASWNYPNGVLIEFVWKDDAANIIGGYSNGPAFWTNSPSALPAGTCKYTEFDFNEVIGSTTAATNVHNWDGCGGTSQPIGTTEGITITSYQTEAFLVTNDGNNHIAECVYINGTRDQCFNWGTLDSNGMVYSRMGMQFAAGFNCAGGCTSPENTWIKYIKVYTCSNWLNSNIPTAACSGTSFNGNFYVP